MSPYVGAQRHECDAERVMAGASPEKTNKHSTFCCLRGGRLALAPVVSFLFGRDGNSGEGALGA